MLYKWCFKIFEEPLTTMMTILLLTLTGSSNRLHVLTKKRGMVPHAPID